MNRQGHEEELLGAYVLGVLDAPEAHRVEAHMSQCTSCRGEVAALREMEAALGEVPAEAFLDGPPQGGDLLLQRTLRQVRGERTAQQRRRGALIALTAAAALAGVFWAGTQVSTGDGGAVAAPPGASTPTAPPAGTKLASVTDAGTGVRMTVRVTPAARWVRVHASVTGVPPGERCQLVVVSRDGDRTVAGSWVVGNQSGGEGKGAVLDGSAAVDPSDVQEVVVQNEAGRTFVAVPV
ncbi:anti-sigma factor family protein [Streptomyces sp. NPDC006879]|uniref:anti-sigma factor family protein n=1 Tax=Streptomyces sp. NPDC006879 TaxID=3364767 RepID=UPI0036ACBA99